MEVGRLATNRRNWTEARTKYICQCIVDPSAQTGARSDQESYGCSLSNLPMIVKRLTNIIISDRRYSLCYGKTLRECKAAESVFSLDKPEVITIIRAILFLNDPFQFIFFHTTPDASRVLLFVATLGDFINSFKQSSLQPINHPTKNNKISKESIVCYFG